MKQSYTLIILILSIFSIQTMLSQIIYNADFSNDGDGFADHTTGTPPVVGPTIVGSFGTAPNQWSLSYDITPASDGSANSFKVNGGSLVSDDWGGQGIFTSQAIDISSVSTISIAAASVNSGANDGKFVYFYILDGEPRVETSIGSTNNGDSVNYVINSLDVSRNNSIQVGFEFDENGAGDGYTTSSFTVTEASNPTVNFINLSSTENEANTSFNTLIPVIFSNYSSDVTISVTVDAGSTAETGDYTLNTTLLTFTGNGTQNISLDINNDDDFSGETVILNIAVTSGTADITTSQHTVTINDDDIPIVINEILADPANGVAPSGDANGDGVRDGSQDEFVEIYNISGSDLDISGWVLADNGQDRHTFPDNTIIPANEAIVVFGGGIPVTVPGLVQTASEGLLGLSNGGDTVIIKNDTGNVIVSESYNSGISDQSTARNNDITGAFVDHTSITTNPVSFSPGRHNANNTPFSSAIKWVGATSNDWSTTSNWLDNVVPSTTDDVIIPGGLTNYPTSANAVNVKSIVFESDTSLLFNTSVDGEITYNRNVTSNWHLTASPVENQTIQDLINNNDFATGTGNNIGIGIYDNDSAATPWQYQNSSSAGVLPGGTGVAVKLNTSSIIFKGNMHTNMDLIPVTIGNRTGFNLIGNRYTAYLDSDIFLSNVTNVVALAEKTIWLWDGNQYITKNMSSSVKVAPCQGFFIKAGADANIVVNTSMLSHETTNTFLRQAPKTTFKLFVENGKNKKYTEVFYINNKSTDFDNGYDSSMFDGDGGHYNFAVYTELISNNKGKKLAIQTLPNANHEAMVIPLGLVAEAGKEITFSVSSTNLPRGIEVYLEDRTNNTIVNLSQEKYVVTLQSATNGIGQFYIHTTSQRIGINDITNNIENVGIYLSANKEVTIAGLQTKAIVKIYSISGKELVNTTIASNGVSKISLPPLAAGVYIVKLSSDIGNISKKIILE